MTITLKNFIKKGKRFIIPDYQRGYVWGQVNPKYEFDSVTNLVNTLLPLKDNNIVIFLQGITVVEDGNDIIIVDGQQRITFFFLLLRFLNNNDKPFDLHYAIRDKSNEYLNDEISLDDIVDENEDYQDIYFFKKTLTIFRENLNALDKVGFANRILSQVKFLYIPIEKEQANIVFSMMNGNKADMTKEELIKAELLRSSSISDIISENENTYIRSRLAREWDKWMYWWKDKDVQEFFGIDSILGWLLPSEFGTRDYKFDDFRNKLVESKAQQAKEYFKKLRILQKTFEDWYNNPVIYNYMGVIIKTERKSNPLEFIMWFLEIYRKEEHDKALEKLKQYCYCSLLGMTHIEIKELNKEQFEIKRRDFREKLENNDLYNSDYGIAFKWLLLCNVEEDNKQNGKEGRKFDFSIVKNKSLEHIYPKSKVGHKGLSGETLSYDNTTIKDDCVKLWREDIKFEDKYNSLISASEHSIGNLVLLYVNENSKFNDKEVEEKKEIFFKNEFYDNGKIDFYKSRHLIHTISVFANSKWEGEDIAKNKKQMLDQFDEYYKNVFN